MRPRGGETALVVCRSVTTPLRDARPLALVVGIVGSLWAGTRVALATGNALDQLWGVRYREQPNWFRRRGKALPMLFLLGGGVVLSTLLAGAATATASYGIPARAGGVVLSLLAVVIGLLSWLYLGAHITLLAAEADIVAANRLWPRSFSLFIERPATEGDRRPRATGGPCGRRPSSRSAGGIRRSRSPSTRPVRRQQVREETLRIGASRDRRGGTESRLRRRLRAARQQAAGAERRER